MAHSTTAPRSSLPDGVLLDAGGVLLLPDPQPLADAIVDSGAVGVQKPTRGSLRSPWIEWAFPRI